MRRTGWLTTAGATLALAVLVIPLGSLLVRTPWGRASGLLAQADVVSAVVLSLTTSLLATFVVMLLGTPLALALARRDGLLTRVGKVLVTLPLVLPPVAGGMALLAAFGRQGLIGKPLGLAIPFTPTAVVLAQVFVSLPFYVLTLEGGLRQDLTEIEEAAATQGASRAQVLRYITLPIVMPSVLAGAVLSWARAVGEFGATITFAGNLPGATQTLPVSLYLAAQYDSDAAYLLATLMLTLSGLVLLLAQGRGPRAVDERNR